MYVVGVLSNYQSICFHCHKAWHGQFTYADADGVHDEDVHREARLIGRYTAGTQWELMAQRTDPFGFKPSVEVMPDAEIYGHIAISDSHAVNLCTNKRADADPQDSTLVKNLTMASYCMQHRVGSVCEEAGNRWSLLPLCMCLANQMQHGDFHTDLTAAVEVVVRKYLNCIDPDGPDGEELSCSDEEKAFAEELLSVCHVGGLSLNEHDADADEPVVGEAKRRREADELLAFFKPPWTGKLNHPCPAGCCGLGPCHDRVTSVERGVKLIMAVVCPHISKPAANRYTKVFPVLARVLLMLHFNGSNNLSRSAFNQYHNRRDYPIVRSIPFSK